MSCVVGNVVAEVKRHSEGERTAIALHSGETEDIDESPVDVDEAVPSPYIHLSKWTALAANVRAILGHSRPDHASESRRPLGEG